MKVASGFTEKTGKQGLNDKYPNYDLFTPQTRNAGPGKGLTEAAI
jgi:hypothetical protein